MDFDSYTSPDAEELLRSAAGRYQKGTQDRRALITEAAFAAAFLVCAGVLAVFVDSTTRFTVSAFVVALAAYVIAFHVVFPVGSGWTRPTQVVFIPMLFMLPLGIVPLVVTLGLVLDIVPRLARRRVSVIYLFARIADGIYTLGPVLVLLVFHKQLFEWSAWPVYVLAFAAQILLDVSSGLGRTWFVEHLMPRQQLQMAWVYLTDASLTCGGLLIAAEVVHRPGLLLLALPLIGLLGLFARERQERLEQTLSLSTAYRGTAILLGDVIEHDDEYTGTHSREVVDTAIAVAERLGLGATARQRVEFGALLHDVGKIRVPNEIIQKPGKLDDSEWEVMRQHTVYGEQMLKQVGGVLSTVGTVVRASHERYDGTGYPDGLAAQDIPIEARIVSVCDAFSAMTTNRSYRQAMPLSEAIAELKRCAGTHFDPDVVAALLEEIEDWPADTRIALPGTHPPARTSHSNGGASGLPTPTQTTSA